MRHHAGGLNRTWLAVVGLVLLLVGAAGIVVGAGLLTPLGRAVGLQLTRPAPDDKVAGRATASAFASTGVVTLVVVVGVVLALLGLAWLVAQVPRTGSARPLRLEDDPARGLTRLEAGALTDAVEAQIQALDGVQSASAVLRGDARGPDLTVKVTAGDRTDVRRLLQAIEAGPVRDLGEALDTQVRRLGVQVEVDTGRRRTHRITL
ncbi:Asp23/Gls24 family envelope stress response protein [Microlunatus flavus]|uniref:Alkaline shock response membrane anchor protein AmaP n=1 Tax=Microlunatus flavus TaxID=1036181 RepID=A0A1H9F1V3_9ACTN|nr:hypothetical protein [Microlunatus flavus]SEQ31829.1 hypothetical protein SAMN05421756_103120 [Microlunatus flavus]